MVLFYFFIPFILSGQSIDEPTAPIQTKILKNHNHIRQDDYYWMKRKDSKKVLKYIKQENKVTQTFYNEQKNLIDTLLQGFIEFYLCCLYIKFRLISAYNDAATATAMGGF